MCSERGYSGMKDNPQSTGKKSQQHSHLSLTREKLYELVWSKPMQHIAKEYGVSDRALAKLCARKQVPVPPRGHWAKVNSAQKVTRPRFLTSSQRKNQNRSPQNQRAPNPQKRKPTSLTHGKIEKRRLNKYSGILDAYCQMAFHIPSSLTAGVAIIVLE